MLEEPCQVSQTNSPRTVGHSFHPWERTLELRSTRSSFLPTTQFQTKTIPKRGIQLQSPPAWYTGPHNPPQTYQPLPHWNVKAPSKSPNPQTNQKIISTTSHVIFPYPIHNNTTNHFNKHTCLHSLSPPYSNMSHHNPPSSKRDYYTHHILKTLHIITYSLYIFYCIYLTFTNVYSTFTMYIFTTTSVYKEIFVQRFAKFLQVFNPHFLMVVLLTSCNISHTCNITHTLLQYHPVCVWSSFQRD